MQRLRNTFDNLWAALMLFTRLPLWRIHEVKSERFQYAAQYWPFAGWITGGTMAVSFFILSLFLPLPMALVIAIALRLLLTGALHEDGLADFCDGMGGGHSRQRALEIMKDSHIGTYGVLGLIVYFALLYLSMHELAIAIQDKNILTHLPNHTTLFALVILTADVWAKSCSSLLPCQLTYARKEEEAKVKVIYKKPNMLVQVLRILLALLPICLLWLYVGIMPSAIVMMAPIVVEMALALYIRHRIQGYTGDCCGATFLLCELSIYVAWVAWMCLVYK